VPEDDETDFGKMALLFL